MKKNYNPNPIVYASWYNTLREIAIRHGYSACLHGSLLNDMDIVLVPWTEDADDPIQMLLEMKQVTKAKLIYFFPIEHQGQRNYKPLEYPYTTKDAKFSLPQGRECWALQITPSMYIDISITPLQERKS